MMSPNLILAANWQFVRRIPLGTIVADVATKSFISTHEQVTLPSGQFRVLLFLLSVGVGTGTSRHAAYDALWGDDPFGGPLNTWACFYRLAKRGIRNAPWLGVDYRSVGHAGRIEVVCARTASPHELRGPQRLAA